MKYKVFGTITHSREWNMMAEYEDGKLIRARYFNKNILNTADIVLLKNNICDYNYLVCVCYCPEKKYVIDYAINVTISNNHTWDDSGISCCGNFDLNMDLSDEI